MHRGDSLLMKSEAASCVFLELSMSCAINDHAYSIPYKIHAHLSVAKFLDIYAIYVCTKCCRKQSMQLIYFNEYTVCNNQQ